MIVKKAEGISSKVSVAFIMMPLMLLISLWSCISSLKTIFSSEYIDIFELTLFLFFLCLIIYFLNRIVNFKLYKYTNNQLIITKLFRIKRYNDWDIKSYYEKSFSFSQHIEIDKIYCKMKDGYNYTIDSYNYDNYDELRNIITRSGAEENKSIFLKRIILNSLPYRFIFLFLSMLLIAGFFTNNNNDITSPESLLTQIEVTFESETLKNINRKKDRAHLNIIEYPNYMFTIDLNMLKDIHRNELLRSNKISKAYITILKSDLSIKLLRENEPTFFTKHISWETIEVFQLEDAKTQFFDLKKVINTRNSDNFLGWIFMIMGLLFIVLAVFPSID